MPPFDPFAHSYSSSYSYSSSILPLRCLQRFRATLNLLFRNLDPRGFDPPAVIEDEFE